MLCERMWLGSSGASDRQEDIRSCFGDVKYSAAMVNRWRRGPDGKTGYELRKERKFARAPLHFAEKILFMIPGVTKGKARVEQRWEDGVFLWCV